MEADGVGRGNQVNIFRILKAILRDAFDKGATADLPVKGVQEPEYVRERVVVPSLEYVKQAPAVGVLGVGGRGGDLVDQRDLRPQNQARRVREVVTLLVVLVVRHPHRRGTDLPDQSEVLLVVGVADRPAGRPCGPGAG